KRRAATHLATPIPSGGAPCAPRSTDSSRSNAFTTPVGRDFEQLGVSANLALTFCATEIANSDKSDWRQQRMPLGTVPGLNPAISRIGFLLIPDFPLMSYASAVEPLRAANRLAGKHLYHWWHATPDNEPAFAS